MNEKFFSEDINWEIFTSWFNNYPQKVFNLEFSEFKETGRGLKAIQQIKTNDPVVSIPQPCLINYESIVKSELSGKLVNLTSHQLIALYVLIQVYRAEESEWKAYLNTLPKSFPFHRGLIANWDKLVNYLPLDFKDQFKAIKDKLTNDYQIVNQFVKENQSTMQKLCRSDSLASSFELNYQEFEWSWLIVNTRCIYLVGYEFPPQMKSKELMTLAPGLDLLNHNPMAKTKTKFNKAKSCLEIINEGDYYEIGDEVFISYGAHDNNFLLAEYGFLIPSNSHDYWKIDNYLTPLLSTLINTNSSEFAKNLEFLKLRGYSNGFYLDYNTELDFKLKNYLRYLIMPETPSKLETFEKFLSYEIEAFEGELEYLQVELNNIVTKLLNSLREETSNQLFTINIEMNELIGSDKDSDLATVIDFLIMLWTARYNICNTEFEV